MPIKDKEKNKAYQREWKRRQRVGLTTTTKVQLSESEMQARAKRYIERTRSNTKKWRIKLRKKRDLVFGTSCSLCGYDKILDLHRKDGEPHKGDTTQINQALKEPDKWIRLCRFCHGGVHFCMEKLALEWGDIENYLKESGSGGGI